MEYNIRYMARFLVEADSPLAVGTGDFDLLTDAPVALDCNGLPVLPGTAICGILRHSLVNDKPRDNNRKKTVQQLFGFQEDKIDNGAGSRLLVSNGLMVGKAGQVIEGLQEIDGEDEFYQHFLNLPVRHHCRITAQGTADAAEHGKFDNRVVYKGCRFVFELELIGNSDDQDNWETILNAVKSPLFRIGGGIRKGYGALKTISLVAHRYELTEPDQLSAYLVRSSSLADSMPGEEPGENYTAPLPEQITGYRLSLQPDDFFIFGAGFGDRKADIIPVSEKTITWQNGIPSFGNAMTLLPASSVKGAVSHRTAFYYNQLQGVYADDSAVVISEETRENNQAVQTLFGTAKDDGTGCSGKVILSDLFVDKGRDKILNHVAIDRFTQAPIDGALFNERVESGSGAANGFTLEFLVEKDALDDDNIQKAFEMALNDIATGMLPLGGGVMRGHGVFTGTVEKKEGGGQTWTMLSND